MLAELDRFLGHLGLDIRIAGLVRGEHFDLDAVSVFTNKQF